MRVTSQTFPSHLVGQLDQLAQRQNRLQNQAATGQRIHLPEDDPTAMRRILDLQGEAGNITQYQSNVQRLREQSQVGYEVMRSLKQLVDRAGEIATLADGTKSPESLKTYAIEVEALLEQGIQFVNAQHRGDYLFSGTRNDTPPYTATRDGDGRVTSVVYQGNSNLAAAEIAENVTTSAMTIGENTTGTGPRGLITDSRAGADFFNHLMSLRDNLRSGNTAAITSTNLKELKQDEDNFLVHYGSVGAIQARLEAAESIARTRGQSIESLVSKEADADLAQTLVRLSETQNAYRAALQSGGTILNQSLLDYLR
ncbi:MAG TPA: flagellin [Verrucomicrobiales bacterium]|nr:flagellin [Verrucomicrobiales bacterium]